MTTESRRWRVLIAEPLSPAAHEALGSGVEIRVVDGARREALLEAVRDVHALIVRSATRVDRDVFAHAKHLTVVARAGVGLDNVDVAAATEAGVMVINAPTSNIVSAAELAIAHILAGLRRISEADASVKAGTWKRNELTGTELYAKTVGIVGFGRIGQLVAQRLRGFDVSLIVYDPYIAQARAAEYGAQAVSLDELMERSDVVTVHMPKTPETVGLISTPQFERAKPALHIVNAARGGLVDEDALFEALSSGRIASAALDVFSHEPPIEHESSSRLLSLSNVTVTPHLGASTHEAQERAGVAVAKSVLLALEGELVPDAVNVAGGSIDNAVRPGIALADRLGQFVTALSPAALTKIEIHVRGEIAVKDVKSLELSALRGVFRNMVSEPVSYVNAPVFAMARGIDVELVTSEQSERFRNRIELRCAFANGERLSVSGTLSSKNQEHKIVGIDEHELDVPFTDHMLVLRYDDRPGVVGDIGSILGADGINIAGMQVSRLGPIGSPALLLLNLDEPASAINVERIKDAVGARSAHGAIITY